MYELKNGKIGIFDLPDSFFRYLSKEKCKCSKITRTIEVTPLMWLVLHAGDPDFYNILVDGSLSSKFVENINQINSEGWTALMVAAAFSITESTEGAVKILLDAGANPNLQTPSGCTALSLAADFKNQDSLMMLLLFGANDKNAFQNASGEGKELLLSRFSREAQLPEEEWFYRIIVLNRKMNLNILLNILPKTN